MTALPILITNAGWAKYVEAQLDPDIDLNAGQIGFTAADFVMAPTLTALPGEFKRLGDLSGQVTGIDTIHLTCQDDSADAYTIRGFGLFLDDGTLFAVYGQGDPIVQKASAAVLLQALDIKMLPQLVAAISFGPSSFLYPPATELVKGVAEIATQAEADTGTDHSRIITPLTLASRLGGLALAIAIDMAAKADKLITITGGGLVNGGGDLSDDRQLSVAAATVAEVQAEARADVVVTPAGLAGLREFLAELDAGFTALSSRTVTGAGLVTGGGPIADDPVLTVAAAGVAELLAGTDAAKALTPATFGALPRQLAQNGYCQLPSGHFLVTGRFNAASYGNSAVTFPYAFPNACAAVAGGGGQTQSIDNNSIEVLTGTITNSGFSVNNSCPASIAGSYIAIGW